MKMFKTFTTIPPLYFKLETNGYLWRVSAKDIPSNLRYSWNWDRVREEKHTYRWQACRYAWHNYRGFQKQLKKDARLNNDWHEETDGDAVFKTLIKKNQ